MKIGIVEWNKKLGGRCMLLYPDYYYENVQSIPFDILLKNGIKGIILDVDNTLIDYSIMMPIEIKEWVQSAKQAGFKICILSNSNKEEKVSFVAHELMLDYFMGAKKPLKRGFKKVLHYMNFRPEECVAIGDQIFTDVLGANLMHMSSIYVKPINSTEYWYTKWKRPIETLILKNFLSKS